MKKIPFIFLSIIIFIIGFGLLFRGNSSESQSMPMEVKAENINTTTYLEYSPANLISAQTKGSVLLFFAATNWCQSCSELDQELWDRIDEIPPNLTVLKVDYDNDKKTNQTYNIVRQHTLVLLDQHGIEQKRWVGGGVDTLLHEFFAN